MKTLVKTLIIIAFLLIFSLPAPGYGQGGDDLVPPPEFPAQDLRFQHLTTEDGLSEGRVWSIIQDRRSFMWFTTLDGLNRYDGYEFKVYKQEFENPNSPGGEGFFSVYEDQDGMIWAASFTGGGLSRFDPMTEQWRRYQHDPDDPHSLSSNNVYDVLEDRMGVLWVGTEGGGLNRFEGETGTGVARFTRYPTTPDDPSGTSSDFAMTIYEDRSGVLWVGTYGGGLNRYDRGTETFTHYRHDPDDPTSLSYDRVFAIYEDRFGAMWVGTYGGGLNRFDRETETFTHYRHDPDEPHSLGGDIVTDILEDRSGVLWISTLGGGLNHLDRETNTFVSYQHDPFDPRSLGNNILTALYADQSGILWLGTYGSGIDRLDPFGQGFELTRHKQGDSNSLSNNDVQCVLEDRSGDLWIGTVAGLNHYDPETETFTHFFHDPGDPNSLGGDRVLTCLEDREGVLWMGLDDGGLARLDRRMENGHAPAFTNFTHDPTDPQSISDNDVTSLYEDSSGVLWVGTWSGGLNAFDRQTEDGRARFKRYQYDPEDSHSMGQGVVRAIHENPEGVLWVGTAGGGLCQFDRESELFDCFMHDPNDEHSLSSNTVWAIHQDKDGSLWLGTSAGLNRFSPQTGQFTHYTTTDGLPHGTVVGILEDDASSGDGQGNFWLSTLGGLSRFDPQSGTFHNYDASDGLQGNIFHPAAFKTIEGMMLFGGQQGLTSFYPEDVLENPNIPPVHITGLALLNEPVSISGDSPLQQSIFDTERLELPHEERVISFEFAALDYASPEKNRYRYKLENFDEEWFEIGSDRRFATYTNLDPGEYVFRVIGSNNDGVWNEEGASIHLTITPPWWGTWWFQAGVILLLVGLVAGGFVWQRQSARRRERQLKAQVDERTDHLQSEIEERKQTEAALEESEKEYRDLVEKVNNVIYRVDTKGLITYLNPAIQDLIGLPPEEVIGWHIQQMIHPDDLEHLQENVQNLLSGLETGPNEYRVVTASGENRWVRVTSQPILDSGQINGIQGLLTDITERKRRAAEQQAATIDAERQRLARDMHDSVTQTLYSIDLFSRATQSAIEAEKNETAGNYAQQVINLSQSALADMRLMIFELRPPVLEEVGLGGALQVRLESVEERAGLKTKCVLKGERTLPPSIETELYAVALEALYNTLKHAQAEYVTVKLEQDEGHTTLTISDDGLGFDPQLVEKSGGYGLSNMQERVARINGSIMIETSPEKGTIVTVEVAA